MAFMFHQQDARGLLISFFHHAMFALGLLLGLTGGLFAVAVNAAGL